MSNKNSGRNATNRPQRNASGEKADLKHLTHSEHNFYTADVNAEKLTMMNIGLSISSGNVMDLTRLSFERPRPRTTLSFSATAHESSCHKVTIKLF